MTRTTPEAAAAALIVAGFAHVAVMAAIHEAAFPPAERWTAESIASTLAMPGVVGLVAPAGGMALARCAADEAELLTLAVCPSRQRAGLGRGLLHAVLEHAKTAGAAHLLLEVKATNTAANALYRQAGCTVVGIRRQYYADGADALVLRVGLGAGDGGIMPCE